MAYPMQPSFAGGELTPALYSRVDLQKYNVAARTMRNVFCHAHGGASNRAGTKYVGEVEDSSKFHRLIPFQFSVTQAYILVFGDLTMRVMTEDGYVLDGASPVEIVTPYTSDDLAKLDYSQSADVIYVTHPSHFPQKISRLSATNWTITDAPLIDGPYADQTTEDLSIIVTSSGRVGSVTLTASSALFDDSFVGKTFRLGRVDSFDATIIHWGYGIITVVASDLSATMTVTDPLGEEFASNSSFLYGLSDWSSNSSGSGNEITSGAGEAIATIATSDQLYTKIELVQSGVYKWTASGAGTSEYYLEAAAGGTPGLAEIFNLYENSLEIPGGTVGSLGAGTWDWGDNDTLGFNTVYVRLTDSTDPDSKADGYLYTLEDVVSSSQASIRQTVVVKAGEKLRLAMDVESITVAGSGPGKVTSATLTVYSDDAYTIDIGSTDYDTEDGSGGYVESSFTPVGGTVYLELLVKTTTTETGTATGTANIGECSLSLFDLGFSEWRQAAWSSERGYPRTVTFFEQRLIFGGSDEQPQTMWHSKTADFENFGFSTPLVDSDSFNYTLASGQVNELAWSVPLRELILGTKGTEWRAQRGSQTAGMTPSSIDVKLQSQYGSAVLKPLVIGNSILFAQRGAKAVRDLNYSLEADGYAGNDMSVMAQHLFEEGTITDWAYARLDDSIVWSIRSDGELLGMTYLKEQQVFGWHHHDTDGEFESVAVIPGDDTDIVFFIVKRTVEGSTVRYIEKMMPRITNSDDGDYYFVDSGLSYYADEVAITGATQANPIVITAAAHGFANGDDVLLSEIQGMTELNWGRYEVANKTINTFELTNIGTGNDVDGTEYGAYVSGGIARDMVSTVSGLDHLEGETVAILVDGGAEAQQVVSNGSITLPEPGALIHVGLPFTSDIESLDLDLVTQEGATAGRIKSVPRVIFRVRNTRGFFAGPDEDNLTEVRIREEGDFDDPIPVYTGDKEIEFDSGHEESMRVFIRNEDPIPMTILGIIPELIIDENI